MDAASDWARLCALLDEDDALWPAVQRQLAQPDGDPLDALIGGLDDAGALAYLDADDTGMELADALRQLPRVFAAQPDLDEANDTDDLAGAIAAADRALTADDLRLVRLEEPGSDALALVVVRVDDVPELTAVAARCEVPLTLER